MTTTSLPCLLDIFTFSTLDDGTTQIFQRYAKETDGGVIASYVAQIKDGKISFVTQRPPAALVDFGRFAAAMVADESWPHPHRLDTRTGEAMSDPRSDEHKYPEGDMNANPTRPFYVDTDLSHYVVREQATGKSLTKRCTFDEADHACNLLNYGWRACQKQATDEMSRQQEVEARERALFLKQIAELEAMVYHTPPGQMEYAPEGWTWRQEAMRATGKTAPLGGCE